MSIINVGYWEVRGISIMYGEEMEGKLSPRVGVGC